MLVDLKVNNLIFKDLKNNLKSAYFVKNSFKSAKNSTVKDLDNNKYIDFSSGYGVVNIGWQNKKMINFQLKQIKKSNYAPPWMPTEEALGLSKLLISLFKDTNYKCIRTTGGANGNEAAISIFQNIYGGTVCTFDNSYHGWSQITLGMSEIKGFKLPLVKKEFESKKIKFISNQEDEDSFIDRVEAYFQKNTDIKIFIAEPILASGGVLIPSKTFWLKFYNICKKYNIFLILDESITAFGRIGHMLASNYYNISPDAIILAKGITSGYAALGAVLIKEEHISKYKFGDVSATFAWTPFSCAIAKKNIDIIKNDRLCNKSKVAGKTLKDNLNRILKKYFSEGQFEIRGIGMMIAIEFFVNNKTYFTAKFFHKLLANKLITCFSGDGNSILIMPPISISKNEMERGLKILENTLKKLDLNL